MSTIWNIQRLKAASIGPRTATYQGVPSTRKAEQVQKRKPEIFEFEAVSIGDENGQAFLVPLDESSKETAEYILRAIAAYEGD